MARVLVVSDDGATVIQVRDADRPDGEPWAEGVCPCGEVISDRGHFEDTVQACEIHLDEQH
ncbi:hypothetical protein FHR83_006772 [Actinoplanes campanulatus]|uniref:Uncharacterized protein n=1 Tax=Actinoplanes campanulatus TaxID=113559 RepID=A0A7W5AMY2_9ACTN|nr:hypothetical protein [Actinoplanes campanulatus]MBB3099066.1 hypothetical protein [Actinoplanes campanulatus]GGN39197.1 hypothetical protein GCM10010109_66860 [Actinoplanes campanulatus]GID40223.1 hypothetical protein Aca09nite_67290 [Actinoplanes campanulatus]